MVRRVVCFVMRVSVSVFGQIELGPVVLIYLIIDYCVLRNMRIIVSWGHLFSVVSAWLLV